MSNIFGNISNEILVIVIYYSMFLYFIILNIKDIKNKNKEIKEIEKRSYIILMFSIFIYVTIVIFLAYFIYYLSNKIYFLHYFILPPIFIYIGLIISLIGLIINIWGKISLGRYFSTTVTICKGHKVIDKGPYKYIRHPIYSGAILIFLGIPIVYRNVLSIPLILILIFAYNYRASIEEELLIKNLGEEYLNYKKRVKYKFFPYIF
ncbi:isoprenylcysteine carboxyl methyltransferase [Nanoarchaeota archaeon]